MVRFTVLASGSKGNSTVVSSSRTRILVDAGLSCRELFKRMRYAGEEPETLDAILITHEHSDHVYGLAVTARKLGIPVYITAATHDAWRKQMNPSKRMTYSGWMAARKNAAETPSEPTAEFTASAKSEQVEFKQGELFAESSPKEDFVRLSAVEHIRAGDPFTIGDIDIRPFTIPHDAADPVGFRFCAEGVNLTIATDLGYMPPNVEAELQGVDLMMLESNHDLDMLRDGPYPWSVKQRVLSRVGHLSNDAAASYLSEKYPGGAEYIILAHLSESNNLPELAQIAAERALNGRVRSLHLARQQEPLPSIYF